MKRLEKYSFGMGDRFAHQAQAQLQALVDLKLEGVDVVPVWNKSNREHLIIGSEPKSTRVAADEAVKSLDWSGGFYCDADHIRLDTVERFLPFSDFFTIDVADSIGAPVDPGAVDAFIANHPELTDTVNILGIDEPIRLNHEMIGGYALKYLAAIKDAGRIYRRIIDSKGEEFVTEISMDETDEPQTPSELLIILAAIADEKMPIQTIAPKFTGRFNKGVDYQGNVVQFEKEFSDDIAVIAHAVRAYGLPDSLKLSVHSGSDKFSIYGPIKRTLERTDAGLHLKTAGTTWLEEIIGLAEADRDGLDTAKEIYIKALAKREELCAPYAAVIDIDPAQLPSEEAVREWTSEQFVRAVRHVQTDSLFNPSMRQLLHVGYKVAAQMGREFLDQLELHEAFIARNVRENLYERHLKPLFLGDA